MNFEQAKRLSLMVKWKVTKPSNESDCWYRIIVPADTILYNYPENPNTKHEYVIVGAEVLDQQTAEHIVQLHNEQYENIQQKLKFLVDFRYESLINNKYKYLSYKSKARYD